MNDLDFLNSIKTHDFDQILADIGRSKHACYSRWRCTIVPILKSDTLGLTQNVEWQKDVLRYIIEKNYGTVTVIPYNKIVMDVCPGQFNQLRHPNFILKYNNLFHTFLINFLV